MKNFSIKQAFGFAVKTFSKHSVKIFLFAVAAIAFEILLISFVLIMLNLFIPQQYQTDTLKGVLTTIIFFVLPFFLQAIIFFMLTCGLKKLYKENEFGLKNCFPNIKILFKFIGGLIVISLPTIIAICAICAITGENITIYLKNNGYLSIILLIPFLFVISAIIITLMMLRYGFFYLEIFEGYGISDSFKKSALLTVEKRKKINGTLIIICLLNFLCYLYFPLMLHNFPIAISSILILLSVFILPLSSLFLIDTYNQLKEIKEQNDKLI